MLFACHCRGRTPPEKGGCMKTLQGVKEYYYTQECYESLTSNVSTPNNLTEPNLTLPSFAIRLAPPPTAHDR